MRNPRSTLALRLAALVGAALVVAACSSAPDRSDSADEAIGGGDGVTGLEAPADGAQRDAAEPGAPDAAALKDGDVAEGQAAHRPASRLDVQQALIRRGTVELTADDVGSAQQSVRKVVDRYAGQVSDEETTTGESGEPAWTRMVLQVPSAEFDRAMADLKEVAELESATTTQEDVTGEMIDTRTRMRVQQRSIARISLLLDRAQSIGDIMRIEGQLSQRQARLDSLKRRLAYLSAQTSMSTITVHIDQAATAGSEPGEDDEQGFVAGLRAGWSALASFAGGLATVAGALLPWAVVIALLGPPLWLAGRALRRRLGGRVSADKPGRTPSAA